MTHLCILVTLAGSRWLYVFTEYFIIMWFMRYLLKQFRKLILIIQYFSLTKTTCNCNVFYFVITCESTAPAYTESLTVTAYCYCHMTCDYVTIIHCVSHSLIDSLHSNAVTPTYSSYWLQEEIFLNFDFSKTQWVVPSIIKSY
jgi:hypothetical protein